LTTTPLAAEVITQVAPSFHGFYRAIISTPFAWALSEWQRLFDRISSLFSSELVDRLNNLLPDYLTSLSEEDDSVRQDQDHVPPPSFIHTLLSRYLNGGRPLSGYLAVCSVIEIQWTVLAQTLLPPSDDILISPQHDEAAAANHVWAALLDKPAPKMDALDVSFEAALRATIGSSMQCFTDLLVQIEELDGEPPVDTYAWETMSESLVSNILKIRPVTVSHHFLVTTTRNLPQSALLLSKIWMPACSPDFGSCSVKTRPYTRTWFRKQHSSLLRS
jgi:phosphatidylinositol 4-kinase A